MSKPHSGLSCTCAISSLPHRTRRNPKTLIASSMTACERNPSARLQLQMEGKSIRTLYTEEPAVVVVLAPFSRVVSPQPRSRVQLRRLERIEFSRNAGKIHDGVHRRLEEVVERVLAAEHRAGCWKRGVSQSSTLEESDSDARSCCGTNGEVSVGIHSSVNRTTHRLMVDVRDEIRHAESSVEGAEPSAFPFFRS